MSSLDSDLIDFIRSYREPVKLTEAASELHHLGNLGCDWKRASFENWVRELERLVQQGLLVCEDEKLSVPKTQGQLSLFE